ncbi:hypothetical protein LINGRAPRIM_LOCUS721 [Linum grandiflorum]
MTAPSALKPPDPISGLHRPPLASSSPSGKGDRDTQQEKKCHTRGDAEGGCFPGQTYGRGFGPPNAWNQRINLLFDEHRTQDGWYVADSHSEDVAEAQREEDGEVNKDEEDPLCPEICFMAEKKTRFWRP